jgi:hypothetical protein
MTDIYNMTPAQYAAWWQRIRDKRKDDLQVTYACPECGKMFPYKKHCLTHIYECCPGAGTVRLEKPCTE